MRLLPRAVMCVFLVVLASGLSAGTTVFSAAAPSPTILPTDAWTPTDVEEALVQRTNADRALFGLLPLEDDPALLAIARERAASQLGEAPLTHNDADGRSSLAQLFDAAGIQYVIGGENLARWDVTDPELIDHIEQALMASPTHRENILRPQFTRIAIGVASSGRQIVFAETYRAVD